MKNSLQATLENAKSSYQKGAFEASKKQFIELLHTNYEPVVCHYYLGLINLNFKNLDEAVKEFSVCLKKDPRNVNYLYYSGTVAELQGNNDLAVHYYYKTLNEDPAHVNSINALDRLLPAHRDDFSHQVHKNDLSHHAHKNDFSHHAHQDDFSHHAHKNNSSHHAPQSVFSQQQFPQHGHHQNGSSVHSHAESQNKEQSQPIQLYDELEMAKDPDSQIAVQMIKATAIKRRPRLRAFIGVFLLRVIFLPILFTIMLGFIPVGSTYFMAKYNTQVMINWYIFFVIISIIYHLIWVKSQIINIDRGFIDITKGVFSRNRKIFLCHKADHFEIHQNFFNLITGDCTLSFDLDSGHEKGKLKITGLGRLKDINSLATNLQNLRYQLRNTPAIRSGIYG